MLNISIFGLIKLKTFLIEPEYCRKNKNILRTSEAENCYFLRTLNLGSKNVVLIKKKRVYWHCCCRKGQGQLGNDVDFIFSKVFPFLLSKAFSTRGVGLRFSFRRVEPEGARRRSAGERLFNFGLFHPQNPVEIPVKK